MFRFVLMSALLAGATAPFTSAADAAPATPVSTGVAVTNLVPAPAAPRRNYFLGLHSLEGWKTSLGARQGEIALTSPPLEAPLGWNEMVPSWNAALPPDATLAVDARAIYAANADGPEHTTKYYAMGNWSGDPAKNPRGSIKEQQDLDGDVDTDTLKLKRHGGRLQVRMTLGVTDASKSAHDLVGLVRFMGFSFLDSNVKAASQAPNHNAWGKTLEVPERFQLDFKEIGGKVWCSPTSVSMILEHWSKVTTRPELNMTVPQVAGAVLDPNWPGTGNWSFNTSFAGSFPGVRGYVARLDDLSEVESWIEAGVPVALSVNHALLQGKPRDNGGHLVVCVGFTKNGDGIIADPYLYTKPGQPYTVFPRRDVAAGWGASRNTVYLIYPEALVPPANSAHHWDG